MRKIFTIFVAVFMKTFLIKLFLGLSLLSASHIHLFSQSLSRQTLSSLGAFYSNDGIILRQTLGQPSNTFLFYGEEVTLRQGFQQPYTKQMIIDTSIPIDFTIYPNPTKGRAYIEINETLDAYNIIINSIVGTALWKSENQKLSLNEIDLKDFLPGIYILTITRGKRVGSKKLVIQR